MTFNRAVSGAKRSELASERTAAGPEATQGASEKT
jgi:hypothetical protein